MLITIPHCTTGATLFEIECPRHLLDAKFGARLGWAARQAVTQGINLSGAMLTRARLTGARLIGARLIGADLTDAVLQQYNTLHPSKKKGK